MVKEEEKGHDIQLYNNPISSDMKAHADTNARCTQHMHYYELQILKKIYQGNTTTCSCLSLHTLQAPSAYFVQNGERQ